MLFLSSCANQKTAYDTKTQSHEGCEHESEAAEGPGFSSIVFPDMF